MKFDACNPLQKLYLGCALVFMAMLLQGTASGHGLSRPTVRIAKQVLTVLRTARKLPKLPALANQSAILAAVVQVAGTSAF